MANKIGEGQWQGLDGKIYSSEGEANTQMGNVVLDNTGSSSFSSYSKAPDIVDKYRAEKAAEDKAKLAAESAALGAAASLEIKQRFAEAEKIVEQGRELCLKGAFDEAIATLNRTINGKNIAVESSAFAWRGRCYFEKGDYAKAFDDINTVIFALSPNALKEHHLFAPERNLIPSIFVMRAFLYEKKGDNNKAIADFKTAANWDWYNQATSREHGYEYADDNIQALKALKNRGVEYTPQLPQIPKEWEQYRPKASSFSKYSTADIGVSNAKKAAEYIEIVMKTYENDPNKAIEYANKIIEIGGEYLADAYSFRATSYLVLGQQDKAIDSFKLAADYGDENSIQILGEIGVNYTPTPRKAQKTSSSGSSSTSASSSSAPIKAEGIPPNFTGKGKGKYPNGDVYEGDWANGERHGKGKMTWANGSVYEGEWAYDNRHGKGKLTHANGNVYEGDWENNKLVNGKMTNANGKVEGIWENGKLVNSTKEVKTVSSTPQQQSSASSSSSSSFSSENPIPKGFTGKGKYIYDDGDIFEGDIYSGFMSEGKKIFTNGDIYEGEFLNGIPNGKGKMTYANGKVKKGKWKFGQLKGLFG